MSRRALRRSLLDPDPIRQFLRWQRAASAVGDPATVCILATADASGGPSARAVILKAVGACGFGFVTDARGRKATELDANPAAGLVSWWPRSGRQIRVEGQAVAVKPDVLDDWWANRPRSHRIASIASQQGAQIASREALDAAYAAAESAASADPPRPRHFVGYWIRPLRVELWQAADGRLHDRFVYDQEHAGWRIRRLQP